MKRILKSAGPAAGDNGAAGLGCKRCESKGIPQLMFFSRQSMICQNATDSHLAKACHSHPCHF